MEELNCSASDQVYQPEDYAYSDGRRAFLIIMYVAFMLTAILSAGIFYWGKHVRKYERLRVRRMALVVISALALLFHAQVGPGVAVFSLGITPCWLRSFITLMIVPLLASSMVLRLMIFYFLSQLSREMTQLKEDEFPEYSRKGAWIGRIIRGTRDIGFAIYSLFFPNSSTTMSRSRLVVALRFVASTKGTVVIFGWIVAPFIIVALYLALSDPVLIHCSGCKFTWIEIYEIIVAGIIYLVFGSVAAFRVRSFPDPWGLRREVLYLLVGCLVALCGFILATFADLPLTNAFDFQLVIYVGLGGFMMSQSVFQVYLAYISEKGTVSARRTIQRNQAKTNPDSEGRRATTVGDRLKLSTVMENPALSADFERFLVSELGVESLIFLRDTDDWKRNYYDIAPSARLTRAKKLYNTYIRPTGTFPVNISYDVMNTIRVTLMHDGVTECPETVFDSARTEISDLLSVGALLRFRDTDEYANYMDGRTTGTVAHSNSVLT